VWKNWPLSPAVGLMMKKGTLNNAPLLDFLASVTKDFDKLYKRITVSALDIETG